MQPLPFIKIEPQGNTSGNLPIGPKLRLERKTTSQSCIAVCSGCNSPKYHSLSIYQWFGNIRAGMDEKSSFGSFPMVPFPIFLFNIYYLFHYQILRYRETAPSRKTGNQNLVVQQGANFITIPIQDIRYIFYRERINYIVSKDSSRYILNETLEELELKLPLRDFFRINRRMIIHHQSCLH